MVGVNIVNIILNPVLIFGLAGFPAFGIAGSALATILSREAGFVIGMLLLIRYSSHITFPKTWSLDLQLIWQILTVAIPNSIQSGLRSVTFLVMMAFVAVFTVLLRFLVMVLQSDLNLSLSCPVLPSQQQPQ
jgi:Na+-driven multidrug efflux pump